MSQAMVGQVLQMENKISHSKHKTKSSLFQKEAKCRSLLSIFHLTNEFLAPFAVNFSVSEKEKRQRCSQTTQNSSSAAFFWQEFILHAAFTADKNFL